MDKWLIIKHQGGRKGRPYDNHVPDDNYVVGAGLAPAQSNRYDNHVGAGLAPALNHGKYYRVIFQKQLGFLFGRNRVIRLGRDNEFRIHPLI